MANGDAPVVRSTDEPVFSDDSGVRAAALKWGVWAICFVAVLLGGALVVILRTHVPLPGVDPLPPSRGQIDAVPATEESTSQPFQPSITFRPSLTATSPTARPSPTATAKTARPNGAVKRAAPTARPTSAPRTRASTPADQARPSNQGTTKPRSAKAATPSPPGSRATSKPGNGPG